ncbi:hypothetical protein [Nostoc sp. FACHB-190]|uniref:hypothetical protein n=1 Tax=Nostoc sp. FACHB-190 TaxID=2692838 RepID=UPI0016875DBC|nr:hypothetical protein [Nostoc sp. FACHB-190]MBD2297620.1 hypothetical protein [Nostoc sp. FACHB-190]
MNQKSIFITYVATILAICLAIDTSWLGISKFIELQAHTGGRYPIFPNLFSQLRTGLEYLTLNIIYLFWLRNNFSIKNLKFQNILKNSTLFLIIAFLAYPLGNDVYLYLQYGVMNLNHVNPFIQGAGNFSSHLSPFLRWGQTSTYGPIAQIFFVIGALFTSIHIILGIYVLKLLFLIFHLVNTYLIYSLLNNSQAQTIVTIFYVINPLILFEQVTNAHLDVLVGTTLLLSFICFKYCRYVWLIVTLVCGFFTKTIPIIYIPLVLVRLVKEKKWKSLALATSIIIIVILILERTILPTIGTWKSLLNPGATGASASLHKILLVLFSSGSNELLPKLQLITYIGFAVYYCFILLKIFSNNNYKINDLILDIGRITLVLFLFATAWNMPWYVSLILPMTALLNFKNHVFLFTSLAFYLSSSCYYLLASFHVLQSIVMVGLPILGFLFSPQLQRQLRMNFPD